MDAGADDRVMELARSSDHWDEDLIASMFGMVAHCAYHLGAVRQMIKFRDNPVAS